MNEAVKRVILISPHLLFREGLARLIAGTEAIEVCGAAESWPAARAMIAETAPDVIIIDHDGLHITEAHLAQLNALTHSPLQAIFLTLDGNTMVIHERRTNSASANDLLAVLQGTKDEFDVGK